MASGSIKARTDSGWQNVTNDGKITYRVVDKIVYLMINGFSMSSTHTQVALPSSIAPPNVLNPFARSSSTIISCWIDGSTLHFSSGSAMSNVAGYISYPL